MSRYSISVVLATLTLVVGCFDYSLPNIPNETDDSDSTDTATSFTTHPCVDDNGTEFKSGETNPQNICSVCNGSTGEWMGNIGILCTSDGNKCNGDERCTSTQECLPDHRSPCEDNPDVCSKHCVPLGDDNYDCRLPDDTPCESDDNFCTEDICKDAVCIHEETVCAGNCDPIAGRCCETTSAVGCDFYAKVNYDDCGLPVSDSVVEQCTGEQMCFDDSGPTCTPVSTWALDRINQHSLPLDNDIRMDQGATIVNIFVLGNGIRYSHEDFDDRASFFYDIDTDGDGSVGPSCPNISQASASLAAGRMFGVAKNANLKSVRVNSCQGSGSWNDAAAGLKKIAEEFDSPAVVLFTISGPDGGAGTDEMEQAALQLVEDGIVVVTPTGGGIADACQFTPTTLGPTEGVITVGAVDSSDEAATWENYGSCIDLFAPGVSVIAAGVTSDTSTYTVDSGAAAAALVAGAAALAISRGDASTPAEVEAFLKAQATNGLITFQPGQTGSPNTLLHVSRFAP